MEQPIQPQQQQQQQEQQPVQYQQPPRQPKPDASATKKKKTSKLKKKDGVTSKIKSAKDGSVKRKASISLPQTGEKKRANKKQNTGVPGSGGGSASSSAAGAGPGKKLKKSSNNGPGNSTTVAGKRRKTDKKLTIRDPKLQKKQSTKLLEFINKRHKLMEKRKAQVSRVEDLRKNVGTTLPKQGEILRSKSHWDTLLEEMMWMATDFVEERKFKLHAASSVAYSAKFLQQKREGIRLKTLRAIENDQRKICARISREVGKFWDVSVGELKWRKMLFSRDSVVLPSEDDPVLDPLLLSEAKSDDLESAQPDCLRIHTQTMHEMNQARKVKASLLSSNGNTAGWQSVWDHLEQDENNDDDDADLDYNPTEESDDDEATIAEQERLAQAGDYSDISELALLACDAAKPIEDVVFSISNGQYPPTNEQEITSDVEDEVDEEDDETTTSVLVESIETKQMNDEIIRFTTLAKEILGKAVVDDIVTDRWRLPSILSTDKVGTFQVHQEVAVRWLAAMYTKRLSCVLADDRGLGKEITVIAFLASLYEDRGVRGPHLIVTTLSRSVSWEIEVKSWCPAFRVARGGMMEDWMQSNIVVLSYEDLENHFSIIQRYLWDYIVFDLAGTIDLDKSAKQQAPLLRANCGRIALYEGLENVESADVFLSYCLLPWVFNGSLSVAHDWAKKKANKPFEDIVQHFTLYREVEVVTGLEAVTTGTSVVKVAASKSQLLARRRLDELVRSSEEEEEKKPRKLAKSQLYLGRLATEKIGYHPELILPSPCIDDVTRRSASFSMPSLSSYRDGVAKSLRVVSTEGGRSSLLSLPPEDKHLTDLIRVSVGVDLGEETIVKLATHPFLVSLFIPRVCASLDAKATAESTQQHPRLRFERKLLSASSGLVDELLHNLLPELLAKARTSVNDGNILLLSHDPHLLDLVERDLLRLFHQHYQQVLRLVRLDRSDRNEERTRALYRLQRMSRSVGICIALVCVDEMDSLLSSEVCFDMEELFVVSSIVVLDRNHSNDYRDKSNIKEISDSIALAKARRENRLFGSSSGDSGSPPPVGSDKEAGGELEEDQHKRRKLKEKHIDTEKKKQPDEFLMYQIEVEWKESEQEEFVKPLELNELKLALKPKKKFGEEDVNRFVERNIAALLGVSSKYHEVDDDADSGSGSNDGLVALTTERRGIAVFDEQDSKSLLYHGIQEGEQEAAMTASEEGMSMGLTELGDASSEDDFTYRKKDYYFACDDDDDDDDDEEEEDSEDETSEDEESSSNNALKVGASKAKFTRQLERLVPAENTTSKLDQYGIGSVQDIAKKFCVNDGLVIIDVKQQQPQQQESALLLSEEKAEDGELERERRTTLYEQKWIKDKAEKEPLFYPVVTTSVENSEKEKREALRRLYHDLESNRSVLGATYHLYGPPTLTNTDREKLVGPTCPPALPESIVPIQRLPLQQQQQRFVVSFYKDRTIVIMNDIVPDETIPQSQASSLKSVKRAATDADDENSTTTANRRKKSKKKSPATASILPLTGSDLTKDGDYFDYYNDNEEPLAPSSDRTSSSKQRSSTTTKEIDWFVQVPKARPRMKTISGSKKADGSIAAEFWSLWEDACLLRAVEVYGPNWELVKVLLDYSFGRVRQPLQIVERYHKVRTLYKTSSNAPLLTKDHIANGDAYQPSDRVDDRDSHKKKGSSTNKTVDVKEIAPWATAPLHKSDLLLRVVHPPKTIVEKRPFARRALVHSNTLELKPKPKKSSSSKKKHIYACSVGLPPTEPSFQKAASQAFYVINSRRGKKSQGGSGNAPSGFGSSSSSNSGGHSNRRFLPQAAVVPMKQRQCHPSQAITQLSSLKSLLMTNYSGESRGPGGVFGDNKVVPYPQEFGSSIGAKELERTASSASFSNVSFSNIPTILELAPVPKQRAARGSAHAPHQNPRPRASAPRRNPSASMGRPPRAYSSASTSSTAPGPVAARGYVAAQPRPARPAVSQARTGYPPAIVPNVNYPRGPRATRTPTAATSSTNYCVGPRQGADARPTYTNSATTVGQPPPAQYAYMAPIPYAPRVEYTLTRVPDQVAEATTSPPQAPYTATSSTGYGPRSVAAANSAGPVPYGYSKPGVAVRPANAVQPIAAPVASVRPIPAVAVRPIPVVAVRPGSSGTSPIGGSVTGTTGTSPVGVAVTGPPEIHPAVEHAAGPTGTSPAPRPVAEPPVGIARPLATESVGQQQAGSVSSNGSHPQIGSNSNVPPANTIPTTEK